MTSEAYRVELLNGILRLTFTRPHTGNSIPAEIVPELEALISGVNNDLRVRAILVRGEGKVFSAGGDLNAFADAIMMPRDALQADFRRRLTITGKLVRAYFSLEVPVIAACRGGVAGAGMMFALGADVVLADDTVKFVFAQQRVGLTPDGGISYLLPRLIGLRRANELVLTGASVGAEEAQRLGLVSRLVDVEALDREAERQAEKLARLSRGTVRRAKRLLARSMSATLDDQIEQECDAIVECVGDPDFSEGVRAAIERRAPSFPSTVCAS